MIYLWEYLVTFGLHWCKNHVKPIFLLYWSGLFTGLKMQYSVHVIQKKSQIIVILLLKAPQKTRGLYEQLLNSSRALWTVYWHHAIYERFIPYHLVDNGGQTNSQLSFLALARAARGDTAVNRKLAASDARIRNSPNHATAIKVGTSGTLLWRTEETSSTKEEWEERIGREWSSKDYF